MRILYMFFIVLSLATLIAAKRVAIIGSGISGLSTAYFLTKSNYILVDIYEKNSHNGGRMFTAKYNDSYFDMGASFFISENKLINEIISVTNTEFIPSFNKEEKNIIILNKELNKLLQLDGGFFYNMFQLLSKYNLGIFSINSMVGLFITKLEGLYDHLNNYQGYENIMDLLDKIGFKEEIQMSINDYLKDKINNRFIFEFLQPLIFSCYNQGVEINSLAGAIIMAAAIKEPLKIKKGFSDLIINLIKKLKKNKGFELKNNSEVSAIKIKGNKFSLIVNGSETEEYDDVVIANNSLDKIKIANFNSGKVSYINTIELLVKGKLKYSALNIKEENYSAILFQEPVSSNKVSDIIKAGKDLYKIQITNDESSLDWLFDGSYEIIHKVKWDEPYSKLSPIKGNTTLVNFKLPNGIYFNNAIEQVVSCVEFSVISAKNNANLLLRKYLRENEQKLKDDL